MAPSIGYPIYKAVRAAAVQTGSSVIGMAILAGLPELLSPKGPKETFNNSTLIDPLFNEERYMAEYAVGG